MSATEEHQQPDDEPSGEPEDYYEWSAYYDDEGRLYYYNATTEESSWDAPEGGFNPPPSPDDNEANRKQEEDGGENINEQQLEEQTEKVPDANLDEEEGFRESVDENLTKKDIVKKENGESDEEEEYTRHASPVMEIDRTSPANEPDPHQHESSDQFETNFKEEEGGALAETIQWIAYTDEEGREYYYNNETGETQWEKPDRYVTAEELEETTEVIQEEEAVEFVKQEEAEELPMSPEEMEDEIITEEEEIPVEPEIDPEILKLQNAEEALNMPDSILEPSCIANVSVVVPAKGAEKAIKALIDSYHGQTAVCGLLGRWFIDFKQLSNKSTTAASTGKTTETDSKKKDQLSTPITATTTGTLTQEQQQILEADANYIRDVAQDVIYRIANERFTREAGDGILELNKSEAAFLEEMMDSPRWRRLLIDLSASHKDSAVLLHCLRAISKRGHHREIAKRINQSDHFAVYNAMLLSELTVLGTTAVSAGSDVTASSALEELLSDLQRACSATAYTYLYSIEILRTLEAKALEEASHDDDLPIDQCRFHRAIHKWQALRQLLESSMIDPGASHFVAGSSPLLRKRRLDVALTITELHQRQRRRKLNREHDNEENGSRNGGVKDDESDLETTMLMLLRRYSAGTQIGDVILDKLLPSGLDLDTRGVGKLFLNHPLAIRALLGHLYKPGTTRVHSAGTKNKCARLVALAVLEAEQIARNEIRKHQQQNEEVDNNNHELAPDEEIDEVALTRMIVQGSQLCEQIETMISFSVSVGSQQNLGAVSSGQKLCALAMKCGPVGLGAMMWAREFTHGHEFSQSASFPTISPSIMSLVRIIAMQHPFTRADALEVALAFLRHSNPDISYQKASLIKEQALRLMIFLLAKGDVAPVLSNITSRLSKSGTSELDASLVRYFVGSVLEVLRPPYSPVFVRLFSNLLIAPRTIDAVRSTYFAKDNRRRLALLLQSFKNTTLYDGSPLSKQEADLVSSLLATYQIE